MAERPFCGEARGAEKSLTRSGLNRHGRSHKNKKQASGKRQYAFSAFSIEFPSGGMGRSRPAGSDRGAFAGRARRRRMADPRYHLLCALRAGRLDRPDQPQIFRAAREATQGQGDRREQAGRFRDHRHRRGDPRPAGRLHHRARLEFVAGVPAAGDEGPRLEIGERLPVDRQTVRSAGDPGGAGGLPLEDPR